MASPSLGPSMETEHALRIVVTGGTGFVGRALVSALAARGDDVVVFSRHDAPTRGRVRTLAWSPGHEGAWTGHLDGVDAVVNLAGAGLFDERWTPSRLQEIRASRIDATRVLAQALAIKAPRAALVSASAVGIYGMRKDDAVLDEDAPHGDDVLTSICEAWESAADPAREAGLRVCHPRLGIVLGRGGGALEKMLPAFKAFVGGPIGDGKQWVSIVHLHDVVSALLRLVDDAQLRGIYNVTAPSPVTMNELAAGIARTMSRPALFRVPSFALKLAMGGGRADALLTGQRVVPKRLLEAGFTFQYPTLDGALAEILR